MPGRESFIPPEFHLPTAWFVDAALPFINKTVLNIDGIDLDQDVIRELEPLRNGRLLYMSNHPTMVEPPVAYAVANRLGTRFHYMASRVVFDWYGGVLGALMRRIGAFSVLPGSGDRDSIRTARRILAGAKGKLCIYPEGMMSGENDNLISFMPGAMQLAFWGLEDAQKEEPGADIPVLCAFVKYLATGPRHELEAEIVRSIGRLEVKLGIDPGTRPLLRRFLAVGRVLLEQAEQEYRIPMASQTDYDYRVGRARHAALDAAAEALGFQLDPNADALVKIRELFAAVESVEMGLSGSLRFRPNTHGISEAKRHIEKAYTFLSVRPAYLLERPTVERFFEWLSRFETVVFGESKPRPRRARVLFAKPFLMSEYLNEYRANRRQGLQSAMDRVRRELETLLAQAIDYSEPIVRPGAVD